MNRTLLSFLVVFLMSTSVFADGLDSLFMQSRSKNDTLRFKAFLKLAVSYRRANLDSSRIFLNLAEKELGIIKRDYNDSVFRFLNAEHHSQMAVYYQQADLYDSSQLFYEFALTSYQNLGKDRQRTRVINNLGALQEQRGNYPEALNYYFTSMRLCDSLGYKDLKARALINIGVVYNNQSNYDEALKYYEQAIPLKRELSDKKGEALLYNNIGIVYYFQGNYEKVLEYFKRSLNIYREIGDLRSQSMPYYNIAEIYNEQKAYKEALYYYKKSYEIDKALGERASQAETLGTIGSIYAKIGQIEDALRVQHESIKLLNEIGAKSRYAEALRKISNTYELKNDHRSALMYFKQYKLMHDSVHTIKKESQIAKIRNQYETEKKDQQINLLQERNRRIELENQQQKKEIKNRQRISILSLIVAALVLFALVMIYRMYRQKKLSTRMLEIKNESITDKNREISGIVSQLEKALKSREILYANTTHELRTPLNIVNGFTNLLLDETDSERRSFYVGQVKSSANYLLRLIEDMLVVSKIETGKFELVHEGVKLEDLSTYITNIFSVLANTKQIKFECEIDRSCPEIVTIDPVRYFQIISNLIDNAIKYTQSGGEVSVEFKYIEKRFLKATIKDSGIGIPDEHQEEIFIRDKRINNNALSEDGSGLGLNIVQQLVDMFEGQIQVNSSKGKGSIFDVLIPSEEAFHITYRYAIVYDDVMSEKMGQGRILIAEDNIGSSELIKQTLVVYNPKLTLDFVHNGEDALVQLRKNAYDLVIIDIKMPLVSGIDVVKKMRSLEDNANSNVPVVAISAQTDDETRKAAQKAGINEFIPKPYEPGVLILKIEELAAIRKKRMEHDLKVQQSEKKEDLGNKLIEIDKKLRNHNYDDAVRLINELQTVNDSRIDKQMHKLLSDLEREIVTTRSNEKIGKLNSALLNYWNTKLN